MYIDRVLVFIDDSGDPGFKIGSGSTPYLVMSCVVFEGAAQAETAAGVIHEARRSLGLAEHREFKFNDMCHDYKHHFFQAVRREDFFVRAIVMRKDRIYSDFLRGDTQSLYNYAIRQVLSHHGGTIRNAKIKIDGSGGREYKRAAAGYFRREVNAAIPGTVDKVSYGDSKQNVLIQLADMVAGAIHRSRRPELQRSGAYIAQMRPRLADARSNIWTFS